MLKYRLAFSLSLFSLLISFVKSAFFLLSMLCHLYISNCSVSFLLFSLFPLPLSFLLSSLFSLRTGWIILPYSIFDIESIGVSKFCSSYCRVARWLSLKYWTLVMPVSLAQTIELFTHVLSGITGITCTCIINIIPDKEPNYRAVQLNIGHLETLYLVLITADWPSYNLLSRCIRCKVFHNCYSSQQFSTTAH